ncbi:hypothetical protein [Gordonia sp. NPDC003376]
MTAVRTSPTAAEIPDAPSAIIDWKFRSSWANSWKPLTFNSPAPGAGGTVETGGTDGSADVPDELSVEHPAASSPRPAVAAVRK